MDSSRETLSYAISKIPFLCFKHAMTAPKTFSKGLDVLTMPILHTSRAQYNNANNVNNSAKNLLVIITTIFT